MQFSNYFTDSNDSHIHLDEENGQHHINYSMIENPGAFVQWNIQLESYPEGTVTWYNNVNESFEIQSSGLITNKYYAELNPDENTLFRIQNVNLTDSGTYIVKVKNKYEEKSLALTLTVIG